MVCIYSDHRKHNPSLLCIIYVNVVGILTRLCWVSVSQDMVTNIQNIVRESNTKCQ